MTEKYAELAVADPIFGQLQNCMELAVVGALVVKERLTEKAGYSMPTLLESPAVKPDAFNAPKQVREQGQRAEEGPQLGDQRLGRRGDQLLGDRRQGQAQRQGRPRSRQGRPRRQQLVVELTRLFSRGCTLTVTPKGNPLCHFSLMVCNRPHASLEYR